MRRSITGLILLLMPIAGWAQEVSFLPDLIACYPARQPERVEAKIRSFISQLAEKQPKFSSQQNFIRFAFRETHRKFFHTYQPYTQFAEIFETGKYDCLSATSLMSVVLEQFDFKYEIIETNYHIFLLVETNEGKMLMETTDRANGITTNPQEISKRISHYKTNELYVKATSNKSYYKYGLNLYQEVKPTQLTGLLYFNQAVSAFNNKDFTTCAARLLTSRKIYDSPRVAELAVVLVKSVAVSDMPDEKKKDLIRPFVNYLRNDQVIASR